MNRPEDREFSEITLTHLIERIIESDPEFHSMQRESRMRSGDRVDILAERNGIPVIVEIKRVAPQTQERLEDMLEQLHRHKERIARQLPGRQAMLALVIPGVLTRDRMRVISEAEIELWDQRWIIEHGVAVGLEDEVFDLFGDSIYGKPTGLPVPEFLQQRLRDTSCGRTEWYHYQNLCGEILEYLFCPPLKAPIPESSNASRINRRDFIVPNYTSDGFWHFMRIHYRADYIVVDAKNHCGQANKTHVLQLANYLSPHGAGLFGMIVTRNGMDRSGVYTCREQWMLHSKMIITLNDEDLLQMLETKGSGANPDDLVRQKIEDFRLGMLQGIDIRWLGVPPEPSELNASGGCGSPSCSWVIHVTIGTDLL